MDTETDIDIDIDMDMDTLITILPSQHIHRICYWILACGDSDSNGRERYVGTPTSALSLLSIFIDWLFILQFCLFSISTCSSSSHSYSTVVSLFVLIWTQVYFIKFKLPTYTAPIIMMSQDRQSDIDRVKASDLHEKVDHIRLSQVWTIWEEMKLIQGQIKEMRVDFTTYQHSDGNTTRH